MKNIRKLSVILIACILINACQSEVKSSLNSHQSANSSEVERDEKQPLSTGDSTIETGSSSKDFSIDIVTEFPDVIEGCSCYYAKNQSDLEDGKYIYFSDFDSLSIVYINGVETEFHLNSSTEIQENIELKTFSSQNFEMTVEEEYVQKSGYETWHTKGKIIIANFSGAQIMQTFFGECGC